MKIIERIIRDYTIIKVPQATHHQNDVSYTVMLWRRGVVIIATAQLHSTKPDLGFCTGSDPAHGMLEIRDGDDL